jgi:hypothetical protein
MPAASTAQRGLTQALGANEASQHNQQTWPTHCHFHGCGRGILGGSAY